MHLVKCSHFIVPELGPATRFSYSSRKAVNEYKEGKEVKIVLFPVFSYNTLFCCGLAVTICVPVVGLKLGSS
jgi:hypothetical protein